MLENAGIICLGAFLGYMVMFCLKRLKEHTAKNFVAIFSFILGGYILNYFTDDNQNYVYYIGLFLGLLLNIILTFWKGDPETVLHGKR